ncbi:MAG: hypothetical protein CVU89_12900 [Firmicutes bacterium HGW-Firmicutes-14]|nr:MAG: hypothetical protein CVU89_12900 [Firmicutes bacterium HGW-Firmicutes-14]
MNEILRILRAGGYALEGLVYLMKEEKNSKLLLGIAILALILCPLIGFSVLQTVVVFFTVMVTLVAEILNTAIEITLNLEIQGRYHPKVKIAKDVAACAVFLCVITSVTVFFAILLANIFTGS